MPVQDVTQATSTLQQTAESVSFSDGAAGTTQRIKLKYDGIMSQYGERIGKDGDSSFSFTTGTILVTEVPWRFKNQAGRDNETNRLAELSNGQFMMDYDNGYILGKSNASTSSTTDTVSYKVRLQASAVISGSGTTQYAEDSVHVTGDSGTAALVVRKDAPATLAGTDGDYSLLQVNEDGYQRSVLGGVIKDGVATPGAVGDPVDSYVDKYGRIGVTDAGVPLRVAIEGGTSDTSKVDDQPFTVSTDKVTVIGYVADESGTDSVDEGDVGVSRMTLNRRQIMAGQTLDDAAFGIGTEYANATGFLADDTATDSVDEGDIGIARMSLDRKQLIAGSYVDDTEFTPAGANSYVHLIAAQADELGTDSVDEGDVGALRMTTNRRLITAGQALDDTNAGIGTEYVTPAGFLADDTATDSVDEGDVGYARMSLDRKQIMAGAYLDDVAFTPAGSNSYGVMMMGQADDTTPDSVDEGDAGALRITLTRYLKVSQGDLISGEDQTNNVLQVVEKPLAVSTYAPTNDVSAAAEASSVSKASAGTLYGFTFSNGNAAVRYLQFFNSTTVPADTTVPTLVFSCPATSTISGEWPKGRHMATGNSWSNSSTQNTKTIGAADSLADINYA